VHLGQFACMAIFLGGRFALSFALDLQTETARWTGRFGAALAVATLALYGAVLAVDGVDPQAGRECVGECPRRPEGGSLRERRGNSLARVGYAELSKLRAGSRIAAVRRRSGANGMGPATDSQARHFGLRPPHQAEDRIK
jgi:hypothetical protein